MKTMINFWINLLWKYFIMLKWKFLFSLKPIMDWMFVPPLPKFICWNADPHCDGSRRWGLWEVSKSQGWSMSEWSECPYKRKLRELSCLFFHVRTQQKDSHPWTRRQTLARHWIRQGLGVGLLSFQNCEEHISAVYRFPSLRYFLTAAWTGKAVISVSGSKL